MRGVACKQMVNNIVCNEEFGVCTYDNFNLSTVTLK